MQFDVDYNNTNTLQGLVMPPRILRDDDTVPHIADFSGILTCCGLLLK